MVVLKDFQYKLTNKILVTQSILDRIRKIEDNLCAYCKQEPETILHLFVDCDKVKELAISTNEAVTKYTDK